MNNTFQTERLTLKPITVEDADFLYQLMNLKTWLENIGDRNIGTPELALEYIQNFHLPMWANNKCGSYIIINKQTGEKMGISGLFKRDGLDHADLGFAYLSQYHGKGYAYEAGLKIMEIATNNGFARIVAITSDDNKSSRNLIEKLLGKFIKNVSLPNDDEELLLYHFF